jgi:hypothetical protein
MQVQTCLAPKIGYPAIFAGMTTVDDDIQLVRDLLAWAGTNANQAAKKIGVANTTLNRFVNGKAATRLGRDTVARLKEHYPKFPGFDGVEVEEIDYVPIRVLPTYGGMGGGGTGEGERETALISRHLIEREFRGKPDDFELINVRGDSMEPLFHHGDQLLIDRRDRDPIQPGAFAIFDGDAYLVKLVERAPGRRGFYRVFSANDRYSEETVEETETTIMGRPVWFARRL